MAALSDGQPAGVELRETHISWLFLTTDRAFKLKKPLVLDFLDYGSRDRRRLMCLEEVRLNARLAPDLYLGVRALVPDGAELAIVGSDHPQAIDYLVEMRRYDEARTLAAVLSTGCHGSAPEAQSLGQTLARFHAACPPARGEHGAERTRSEIDRNLEELLRQPQTPQDRRAARALAGFMHAFIDRNTAGLNERAAGGRVREGHGDLRAEHVVLSPTLLVVDCVEFDAELRTLDVADDLAFLLMDLARLGADRTARSVVDSYRRAGGDCGPDGLLWFFAVHRTLVRAKVELVRAAQEPTELEDAGRRATELLELGWRLAWRARGPLTVVICGVPASGKSRLAAALAARSRMPVLNSDVVRKQLAGLAPDDRGPPEIYGPEFSATTYGELGRRAADLLDDSAVVLVDATFRRGDDRRAFDRSFAGSAPTIFVECTAPTEVLARRAAARDRAGGQVSDATAEVVERERRRWEPLREIAPDMHLLLDTDRDLDAVVADLVARLDERLPPLASLH